MAFYGVGSPAQEPAELDRLTFFERIVEPQFSRLQGLWVRITSVDYLAQLERDLAAAGNPGGLNPTIYLTLRLAFALIGGGFGVAFGVFFGTFGAVLILALIGMVAAWFAIGGWLNSAINRHRRQMRNSLPDVIDFLVVAVDAGRHLLDIGCDELSLGDTIGVGTPGEILTLIAAYRDAGVGVDRIALHLHDTYGQALANAFAALSEGITVFDASAGGMGGSPFAKMAGGNLATEDLAWMCRGLGIETGIDIRSLVKTSRWLAEQLGRELPAHVSRAMTQT